MRRLGYKEFTAQGGDWGAVVTDMILPDVNGIELVTEPDEVTVTSTYVRACVGAGDMRAATESTAAQVKLITHANREHSTVAGRVLDQLRDIRKITDRNARDVNETRVNTADLIQHAADLAGLVNGGGNGAGPRRNGANGRG